MRKNSVTKFVVIDSNQIYKKGLISILRSSELVEDISEKNNLQNLDGIAKNSVLLVEYDEVFASEEAQSIIRDLKNRLKVTIMTLSDNPEEVDLPAAMELGVCGVLVRGMCTEELISAFRIVQSGDCYVAHDVAKKHLADLCSAAEQRKRQRSKSALTNRESQILKMICDDLTNHVIAHRLFISPRTVDGHRSNILQKLGIRSKAGLVRFALENNMLAGSN